MWCILIFGKRGKVPVVFGPFDSRDDAEDHADAVPITDTHIFVEMTAPGDLTSLPNEDHKWEEK